MTKVFHQGRAYRLKLEIKDDVGALTFKSGAVILKRRRGSTFCTVDMYNAMYIKKCLKTPTKLLAPIFIRSELLKCEVAASATASTHSFSQSSDECEYSEIGDPPEALEPLRLCTEIN